MASSSAEPQRSRIAFQPLEQWLGFSAEEGQWFGVEEELEKWREVLGEDYGPLKSFAQDFIRRYRIIREGPFIHVYEGSRPIDSVEKDFFNKYLDLLLENLFYKAGLSNSLRNPHKAKWVLGSALLKVFDPIFKGLATEEFLGLRSWPFDEKLKYVVENAEELANSILKRATKYGEVEGFQESRAEVKASVIYNLLESLFEFVKVLPRDATGSSEYYVLDENVLRAVDEVVDPVVGALIKKAASRKFLAEEVKAAVKSTTKFISWDQVDPWDKLNLKYGVLDLKSLKIEVGLNCYFRYRLNLVIRQDEIDEIKNGHYDIKYNEIYRLWRRHFDDENWEYLTHSIGTWLAPYRIRHVAFLIGPRGSGKSALLRALTEPIKPLVANIPLSLITSYRFGLEGLIGKQINIYSERGDVVLRRIDVINNLVGEQDLIAVPRKFKQTTVIRSLKAMCFAMNDPPIVTEYGGETMAAFLDRLSIITMTRPEDFKPVPSLEVDPKEAFIFLLWCRVKLEENDWKVRKMDEDTMLDYLMRASNTATRFLESDWIIKDPSAKVEGTELYEAYIAWCREQGITPMSKGNFYATAASTFRKRVEKGKVLFRGLMVNPRVKGSTTMEEHVK
jgi:phage/plasmid-associated DNA primase